MNLNHLMTANQLFFGGVPLVTSACFRDIDRMGEPLKGWQVNFTQRSRGAFQGSLTFLVQGNLQIYQLRTRQAVQGLGAKPTTCWLFAFLLTPFPQAAYSCETSLTKGECFAPLICYLRQLFCLSQQQPDLARGSLESPMMGAMAFLKVLRLHAIRRILLGAAPKSLQVKEVANTWGFCSIGHFSRGV